MAVVQTKAAAALGRWEPSLAHTFLPACRECGERHPLSRRFPPADVEHCPGCGADAAEPSTVIVPAKGGFFVWLANSLQAVARWLHSIAERI